MDTIDRYRELDALLGEIEAPPEPVQAVERSWKVIQQETLIDDGDGLYPGSLR